MYPICTSPFLSNSLSDYFTFCIEATLLIWRGDLIIFDSPNCKLCQINELLLINGCHKPFCVYREDEKPFENELKKLRLSAESDAKFFSDDSREIPLHLESQFLDYINTFTEASEKKEFKKVREVLGNPDLPKCDELPDQNVSRALDDVLDLPKSNNIALDVVYEVSDREIYRFILEDLFEYEMSIINIPDMVTYTTYEEFYPNHEEDLKRYAEEFMTMLLRKDFEFMDALLSSQVQFRSQASH